ncbi:MAG: uncharacterized protein A8A55_0927 [Amphiamblys sp. WSBS2006]|nr:MAG: uncharacterized protein A8A55_0927 [Amphiamblys sp. WSBS2006]
MHIGILLPLLAVLKAGGNGEKKGEKRKITPMVYNPPSSRLARGKYFEVTKKHDDMVSSTAEEMRVRLENIEEELSREAMLKEKRVREEILLYINQINNEFSDYASLVEGLAEGYTEVIEKEVDALSREINAAPGGDREKIGRKLAWTIRLYVRSEKERRKKMKRMEELKRKVLRLAEKKTATKNKAL